MVKPLKSLTSLPAWQALSDHQMDIAKQHMRDWFASDPLRQKRYHLTVGELSLDYSRNKIQPLTLNLLEDLAKNTAVAENIQSLFG